MGQKTQLERIIELESSVGVLVSEVARLSCDISEHLRGFECDVCGKVLSTPLALAGHKRSHGKEA